MNLAFKIKVSTVIVHLKHFHSFTKNIFDFYGKLEHLIMIRLWNSKVVLLVIF